ncbi:MAG TPA: DNA repair protein RadC [Candidatus Dorea gallistercoris]|uniref:DNA repair protein RadC n=1 Tax=Candidatus Dorea gallistercoris TaxID=2838542 RepID=A0A9D1RB18_9FIRM|nr:DNA repair protein RadC [Candidatus Dorea gallistercoris]
MSQSNTIQEIPSTERPYEKCKERGAALLSDAELLAVLLRTGTRGENALELARRILYHAGGQGLLGLHQLTMERLLKIRGIGQVKAVQLLCLAELSRRLAKARAQESLCFASPKAVAEYYMEDLRHQKQEVAKLLFLNAKAGLIGETDISKGTVNASLITPRELFLEALRREAVSIILLHNHPSGDPSPSQEDLLVTERILRAGELIGIELLDHIIIGNNCYISFREAQLLFKKG